MTTIGGVERDKVIDGFRAVAACGVVFSHAVCYRFADLAFPGSRLLVRLADPVSELSVQIFFVISGYIITTLLLKEEDATGRPSLSAFYARRVCRIVPPFAFLLAVIAVLQLAGLIRVDLRSLVHAGSFTCNTGLWSCDWWVAHSWSLAVEEQFYLVWPILFILVPRRARIPLIAAIVAGLLGVFAMQPVTFHANALSFACIATGVWLALHHALMRRVQAAGSTIGWLLVAGVLLVGPLTRAAPVVAMLTPFLIAYLIFAARRVAGLADLLTSRPVQAIGAGSYSIYLWQQVFLARPAAYPAGPLPLFLLPVMVIASVFLLERPGIALGRRWSRALQRKRAVAAVAADRAEAAVTRGAYS